MTINGTSRRSVAALTSAASGLSGLVVAAGCVALFGWLTGAAAANRLLPGPWSMSPAVAIAFVLLGLSLWLQRKKRSTGLLLRVAQGTALLAAAAGLASLLASTIGWDVSGRLGSSIAVLGPGSTDQPITAPALSVLLTALALLLLDTETKSRLRPSQFLCLLTALSGLFAVGGYIYGGADLEGIPKTGSMPLATALMFVMLPLGVLAARPERGLMATVTSDSVGGIVARRLLPAAVLVPLLMGWLRLAGERAGFYGLEFGLVLFALANVVVLTSVVWWNAALAVDIESRQRRSEADRLVLEARLQRVLDIAADAIIALDSEQRIVHFNRGAERIFGYPADEVIGRPLTMLVPPRFAEGHARLLESFAAGLELTRRMGEDEEIYGQQKDGTEFPAEATISKLADNGGTTLMVILRDITERRRAEEALRDSEERYRTVLEQVDEVVYRVTTPLAVPLGGRVELIGGRVAHVVGHEPQDFIDNPDLWVSLIHEQDLPKVIEVTSHVLTSLQPGTRQYRIRHSGTRSYRWIEDRIVPQLDEAGEQVTLFGVARDITERMAAEERIAQQMQRLGSLRAIDMAITASLDVRVTLSVVLDQVTSQLGVDAAGILLLNPATQVLTYAAGRGFRTDAIARSRLRLGEGLAGRAALERQMVYEAYLPAAIGQFARAALLAGEGLVSYCAMPLISKGQVKGVLEIFHRATVDRDPDWFEMLEALAAQTAIAIDNASLFDDLQRSNAELILAYDTTLEGWVHALDLRDNETEGHSVRVVEMTDRLAGAIGVPETDIVHVRRGALLHDVGKMAIPDRILLKTGALTPEEWDIMCRHPQYAYDWLSPITFLRPALAIPLSHHEKWDGTGYPHGLQGEQIPLHARIFAVVDVWDALRSERLYKPAWEEQRALDYIRAEAGAHFDPRVVEAFLHLHQ